MLVIGRKVGERIHIGDSVTVVITAVQGNRVRIGIEAPREVSVQREEISWREAGAEPVGAGRLAKASGV